MAIDNLQTFGYPLDYRALMPTLLATPDSGLKSAHRFVKEAFEIGKSKELKYLAFYFAMKWLVSLKEAREVETFIHLSEIMRDVPREEVSYLDLE